MADDIDSLDVETIEALFEAMKSIHMRLDDGRPATAVFRTWLGTWSERGGRFRLAYDPAEAFWSNKFSELNSDALEPLLTTTLNDICGRWYERLLMLRLDKVRVGTAQKAKRHIGGAWRRRGETRRRLRFQAAQA